MIGHHAPTRLGAHQHFQQAGVQQPVIQRCNTMSAREALAALEKYKNALPPVMWKEIENLTLLRLNTTDEKWEELSPEELAERNKTEWARYRQILNEWKAKNLTEWRAEHDRSSQLIVTRAVCNETAEHIQHIRGRSPAGGLTAKPLWYKNLEKNPPPQSTQDDRPYFKKALAEEHFRPGASILWLRFVNDFPNPWRIANPITLSNGEELLPAGFLSGQESALTGGWRYQIERNGIKRTRTRTESNGVTISEEQWLRWIHEATVVEVAKTAEGTVVLTFETALPYEDKNTSTIGVFKRYLNDLVYNIRGDVFNGTFVGYTPEGDVPSQDLDFMLDWNKILRRQRMDPLAWETYRARIFGKASQTSRPYRSRSSWMSRRPKNRLVNPKPKHYRQPLTDAAWVVAPAHPDRHPTV